MDEPEESGALSADDIREIAAEATQRRLARADPDGRASLVDVVARVLIERFDAAFEYERTGSTAALVRCISAATEIVDLCVPPTAASLSRVLTRLQTVAHENGMFVSKLLDRVEQTDWLG